MSPTASVAVSSRSASRARRAASRREIGIAIPTRARAARPAAPTVLVADDSGDARYCLSRMLEQLGLRVETAADGREAVTKSVSAAAAGRSFDLILMDLTMPVLDGLSATRQIRADTAPHVPPIIAITGDTFPPTRGACADAGCTGYYHGRLDFAAVTALVAEHVPAARAAAARLSSDW